MFVIDCRAPFSVYTVTRTCIRWGGLCFPPSPGLGELGTVYPRAPGCEIKPQGFAELFVFGDHDPRVGSSMTSLSWFEILSR